MSSPFPTSARRSLPIALAVSLVALLIGCGSSPTSTEESDKTLAESTQSSHDDAGSEAGTGGAGLDEPAPTWIPGEFHSAAPAKDPPKLPQVGRVG